MLKFASALSTMLVGWCLTMTGYVPNSVQSEATLMGIRIVSIVLPAVFALISMVVFLKFMKLDRETVEDILKELKMRQNEKKKEMSRTDKAVV